MDGLCEDTSSGEGFHELVDVCGICDGVVASGGKVATGAAVDKHHLDGCSGVPRLLEKAHVGIQVFGTDRAVGGD